MVFWEGFWAGDLYVFSLSVKSLAKKKKPA